MEAPKEQKPPDKKPKKSIQRSPNFPYINLKDAIERAILLYETDGMAGSSLDTVYKHLGYNGRNGISTGIVSALKKFDLIKEENGRIIVTETTKYIKVLPENDNRRLEFIKKCALNPEIYKKLWDKFKVTGFPSDEALRSDLILDYGFNENSVSKFLSEFKATLAFAGLKAGEAIEDFKPEQTEEVVDEKESQNTPDNLVDTKTKLSNPTMQTQTIQPTNNVNSNYQITVNSSRNLFLTSPDKLSKKDIDRLKKWLAYYEEGLEDETTEDNPQGVN